jgi:hypothetical protein
MLTDFSNSLTGSVRDRALLLRCKDTGIEKGRSVKTICCLLRRSARQYRKSDEEEYAARHGLVCVYSMLSSAINVLDSFCDSSKPPHFLSDTKSDVWVTVSCAEGALGREASVRLKVESAETVKVCLAARFERCECDKSRVSILATKLK